VHTVSYKLTKEMFNRCRMTMPDGRARLKVQYTNAGEKDAALRKYLATENAVIFAPSMDRGVDLMEDKCRIQVIAKCPFPSLGDKQVSSRMHLPGRHRTDDGPRRQVRG
jgi:Rad3-related DNA helicase